MLPCCSRAEVYSTSACIHHLVANAKDSTQGEIMTFAVQNRCSEFRTKISTSFLKICRYFMFLK